MEEVQERVQIAVGSSHQSDVIPHSEMGQRIIGFSLYKKAIRIRHFNNTCQPRFISRTRL